MKNSNHHSEQGKKETVAHNGKIRKRKSYTTLPEEKKEEIREKNREKNRKWYASLSTERKEEILKKKREAYAQRKSILDEAAGNNEKELQKGVDLLTRISYKNDKKCLSIYRSYEVGSTSQETNIRRQQKGPQIEHAKEKYVALELSKKKIKEGSFVTEKNIPSEAHTLDEGSVCIHCTARKFPSEPKGFCCSNGDVCLADNKAPKQLYDLFTLNDDVAIQFRQCVRTYNNSFAFTSLGVRYDKELSKRNKGVYTFKVQGQMYHFINELLPADDHPSHLQLYFYDTDHEVENRLYHSSKLKEEITKTLISILLINPYAQFFRSLRDFSVSDGSKIFIKSTANVDQRVFNAPTASQVAGIWIENNNSDPPGERHIVVFTHTGSSHRVNYYLGCYDPLQYPLLFPYGDSGWHQGIPKGHPQNDPENNAKMSSKFLNFSDPEEFLVEESRAFQNNGSKRQYVSCRQYYCYKLQIRPQQNSVLLHSGRLLQQYVVDMYIKLESSRLDYLRNDQQKIRADLYQGIADSVNHGESRGCKIGKRIVLPASFIGGPRDMRRRYLDAMALVQRFGRPDIFLTMTCNPAWSEIKNNLLPGEEAQNRPDLLSRIFKAKLEELKIDLLKRNIFGIVLAHVYAIEFQKRGLPHAHLLIILNVKDKINTPHLYDKFVSAELPDKEKHAQLHRMVVKHMMHGPCGSLNPNNICMKNGSCKNHYPREFCSSTTQAKSSYPIYRRRDTGERVKVRNALLDNCWVVPYNPYLLAKYNCHMNVEVCSTIKAVKYLYKYIYKGHDQVSFQMSIDDTSETLDEIQHFQAGRWISPPEAMWRIFQFKLNEIYPSVRTLQLHLESMQIVAFQEHEDLHNVIQSERASKSMLTEYFHRNKIDEKARHYLYKDFPEYYVWDASKRFWSPRKKRDCIGRIVVASPTEGDRYYLRLLLNNLRGATSYDDLKTINGVKYDTFRQAAEQLGLLESDNSIEECLHEASTFQMPSSLRRLFATVLVYCAPQNPKILWEKFKHPMAEDYNRTRIFSSKTLESKVLQSINWYLESMGKNILTFDLPNVIEDKDERIHREINDELNILILNEDMLIVSSLNTEQRLAYDIIMERIKQQKSGAFFIDGPGGTGKTYLYRALLTTVRSEGFIALATATSGVAASILPGGRTAHSRFKIPLNTEEFQVCNISKQSSITELLRKSKLIIWDEASMARRQDIEILDSMLQDVTDCKSLFGNKVIVFGGDFRQVLPVVPRAGREAIIDASLVKSKLWDKIEKIQLKKNMRAECNPSFSQFLLQVGNGTRDLLSDDTIEIPATMVIPFKDGITSIYELTDTIFPNLENNADDVEFMTTRATLTTKNEFVDQLNEILILKFPGKVETYHSYDSAVDDTQQFQQVKFLNTLTPNGLPPHKLVLKKNCPVMLRNIDPLSGLCNGTRLICKDFQRNVISAEIAMGHHKGERVLLPRIPLKPSENEKFPFPFQRKQFPIRLCFAMTINKAQGQTLQNVGIYLPQPVFSHGQLYVALSRAKSPDSIKMVIKPNLHDDTNTSYTKNIVYSEVLTLACRQ